MHLTLQGGILTNYESTRNAILSYVLSSQTWHGSMGRAPDTDATNDMDIGAVLGKGKGKEGRGMKGDMETRTSFTCGKPGHLSTAWWYKDNCTEGDEGNGKGEEKKVA